MSTEIKPITYTQVMELLNQGVTREEMPEKLGITPLEVKQLFQQPSLKGKKARTPISFVFIDDSVEETKDVINEQVQDAVEDIAVDAVEEINNVEEDPSPIVEQPTAIEQDAADMEQGAIAPETPSPATQAWTN